jgi:hypothetical protein
MLWHSVYTAEHLNPYHDMLLTWENCSSITVRELIQYILCLDITNLSYITVKSQYNRLLWADKLYSR